MDIQEQLHLALIRESGTVGAVNIMNMLIGKTAGTIGETSVIAILIGAMFLILMGVITLRIPAEPISLHLQYLSAYSVDMALTSTISLRSFVVVD